jgi:type III secretion system low calcium response chaperone LcrH/SycD
MSSQIKITDLLDAKQFNKHKDKLLDYFNRGGTWKDLLGYDEALLKAQYKKAYELYQNADYKNAAAAFSFLTMLNPYEFNFWMGLGMSKQSERFFEEAVVSYTAAEAMEPDNPVPHLHLAQCYHAMNLKDESVEQLQETIHLAGDKAEHQEIKKIASTILNHLPK